MFVFSTITAPKTGFVQADVNAQDSVGDTPLHCAVEDRNVEFAQRLIDFGANVMLKNNDGESMDPEDSWVQENLKVVWPLPDGGANAEKKKEKKENDERKADE